SSLWYLHTHRRTQPPGTSTTVRMRSDTTSVSNAQRPSRRHHYIPQWHLKYFSPDGRLIWRYSKSADTYQLIPIQDAAVQRDYYSIPTPDGGPADHSAEPMIAEAFDGPAALVATKLLRREKLTDEDRMQFAADLAFLSGRVPAYRHGAQDAFDQLDR